MVFIAYALVILGITALAGWLVWFTGNLWCLLVLLLILAVSATGRQKG